MKQDVVLEFNKSDAFNNPEKDLHDFAAIGKQATTYVESIAKPLTMLDETEMQRQGVPTLRCIIENIGELIHDLSSEAWSAVQEMEDAGNELQKQLDDATTLVLNEIE